jgi:hypothetical protein
LPISNFQAKIREALDHVDKELIGLTTVKSGEELELPELYKRYELIE